ncbi:MAG: ferrous iron transport protein A [Deltaproteobacteria bacterium]|nr:ferrous iron transport protein A [Deltaproteobacteria bacterium]
MKQKVTLDFLVPGTRGKVLALTATGDLGQRLMDLGFYPGVEFRVIRNAPLLDPFELEMMGYCISLRRQEAGFVEVEPL